MSTRPGLPDEFGGLTSPAVRSPTSCPSDAVAVAILIDEQNEDVKGRQLNGKAIWPGAVFHDRANYICDRIPVNECGSADAAHWRIHDPARV
jgi:hypothetical protein